MSRVIVKYNHDNDYKNDIDIKFIKFKYAENNESKIIFELIYKGNDHSYEGGYNSKYETYIKQFYDKYLKNLPNGCTCLTHHFS